MRIRSNTIWLFAIVYSAVGFAIYFALGIVADRALGLTPAVLLVAGLLFLLTMLTYAEGASMFRERGGSSTFARHAFNELTSFVAGWAVLIDYLVILALAALATANYLEPVPGLGEGFGAEIGVAVAVIAVVALLNIRGVTGRGRAGTLAALACADVALQGLVILVGVFVIWQPELLTQQLDLFGSPSPEDLVYAVAIALLAYAGIETAANLAPDVDVGPAGLRRIVWSGAVILPLTYAATAFVALMAVPVVAGPDGPATELGTTYLEAPFLGVVAAFDPAWLGTALKWTVVLVAVPTLAWAANFTMLGVSRHIYTLAVNRQIPSWLGKLHGREQTPRFAIVVSAVIAVAMVLPRDVKLLAEVYALGATLAIAIAHLSIMRLRRIDPERPRPFRVPWTPRRFAGGSLPLPTLVGAALSVAAFFSVLVFHDAARWVGGGWMVFGLVAYVVYRRVIENTSLTDRVSVPAGDLTKSAPEAVYRTILVPVFGTELDDDIVATAGRLVAPRPDIDRVVYSRLDLVYVVEVPLDRDLDSSLPAAEIERANDALERAGRSAAEIDEVDVTARMIRARTAGAGIVAAAREGDIEAIVIGGEPPSKVRGGAMLGGIGGERPAEIGPITAYILERAPCRVLLTAPPADREGGGVSEVTDPPGRAAT